MRFLDESLTAEGVNYYIVCFSPKQSSASLSDYVHSIGLRTDSFIWTNGLENVLPSIKIIAYPSHILIDKNGVVIKTFPGTSNEKAVRDRMVRQVLKEVVAERNRRNI